MSSSPRPTFTRPGYDNECEVPPGDVDRALQLNNELKPDAATASRLFQPRSDNPAVSIEPDPKSQPESSGVPPDEHIPPKSDVDGSPEAPIGLKDDFEDSESSPSPFGVSPSSTSTSDEENDKLEKGLTQEDPSGKVSRNPHLHRGEAQGPSEARQRRQSSVVGSVAVEKAKVPWSIHLRNAVYGSLNMFFSFPYWDMAFWSGWSYTWGSVLFVITGLWSWTPQQWPSSEFEGEIEYGVGLTFFIGALFYQLGATMGYLEAVNDGSFAGRAMKRHLEGNDEDMKRHFDAKLHAFFGRMIPRHHRDGEDNPELEQQRIVVPEGRWSTRVTGERAASLHPEGEALPSRRGAVDAGLPDEGGFHEYLTWRWWPTWDALIHYHIREMGYVACTIQLFGATLYAICGVLSLPGILSNFQSWQLLGGYWIPQTVASVCFLTAGVMFTLITQEKWYRILPTRIAWWIGAWATVGSMGFLLSATFGVCSATAGDTWCTYQSALSSFWGSFAYLVSSYLQWFETVNNGPVLAFPNNRVPTAMR